MWRQDGASQWKAFIDTVDWEFESVSENGLGGVWDQNDYFKNKN